MPNPTPQQSTANTNAATQPPVVRIQTSLRGSESRFVSDFGAQAITHADSVYGGSRFAEVSKAIFANPYQQVWGRHGEPALPVYRVTLEHLLRGFLRGASHHLFRQATARTVDSRADLRWGEQGKGFRRIVHPNGICLLGRWQISEETQYTGYFAKDSEALIVGRYSSCCTEVRRGHMRSLSLAGKLFGTKDPQDGRALPTAHFFTQQDIGGERIDYVNDVEVRNAPDTTALRRGLDFPILAVVGAVFAKVDQRPSIRQLYEIAELGKPETQPTRAPAFMRLLMSPGQPRIAGEKLDFRDEIMAMMFDKGDPRPKRTLTFDIEVTDEGWTHGPAFLERRTFRNWKKIGRITFDNAVISYNGDFVIHYHHPTWRLDRNDSATGTRVDGRKVR